MCKYQVKACLPLVVHFKSKVEHLNQDLKIYPLNQRVILLMVFSCSFPKNFGRLLQRMEVLRFRQLVVQWIFLHSRPFYVRSCTLQIDCVRLSQGESTGFLPSCVPHWLCWLLFVSNPLGSFGCQQHLQDPGLGEHRLLLTAVCSQIPLCNQMLLFPYCLI